MKALFSIFLFFVNCSAYAQCPPELVVNGGFEEYLVCPTDITGLPTDLESLLGNWWSASDQTPDFFHYCGGFQEPFGGGYPESNVYGGQAPRSGSGMAGFAISCGDSFGEYISTELILPLKSEKTYRLIYWSTNGDARFFEQLGVVCRSNGAEILFTPTEIYWSNITLMTGYTPQIPSQSEIFRDSLNWLQFTYTFQVAEECQYMTIGRWSPSVLDSNCTCFVPETDAGTVYYYIDDISIREVVSIEFPNVFTPNGDNVNQMFQVKGYCGDLHIYNRWGQLLTTVSNETGWNGRVAGEDAPEGTYYCITDDQNHKGAFQLLR